MSRSYYVHIMSSKSGVLYIGSTNDLEVIFWLVILSEHF
jgi:predicted GIY-YIG superfamily endonuclease